MRGTSWFVENFIFNLKTALLILFLDEFRFYIDYTRHLKFTDQPDYYYLRNLFRNLFLLRGFEFDCKYDWNLMGSGNVSFLGLFCVFCLITVFVGS